MATPRRHGGRPSFSTLTWNRRDRAVKDPTSEEFEELLSTLRHELLGPLAILDQVMNTVREQVDDLPQEVVEVLDAGERQLRIARALVDDLRIAGQDELELDTELVDLRKVVETNVSDLRQTFLRDRQVELELPDRAVMVEVDEARLAQIMRNLLDNAHKYSPPREPIRVLVRHEGDVAELWVIDSGDGVTPEEVEEIFEPYVRGDQPVAGLGLGLTVSLQLARAHGGDLRVPEAPEGDGGQFVLELPLA